MSILFISPFRDCRGRLASDVTLRHERKLITLQARIAGARERARALGCWQTHPSPLKLEKHARVHPIR
jgi:hypothetical protein